MECNIKMSGSVLSSLPDRDTEGQGDGAAAADDDE